MLMVRPQQNIFCSEMICTNGTISATDIRRMIFKKVRLRDTRLCDFSTHKQGTIATRKEYPKQTTVKSRP
jgi:hypothetical protein